MTNIHLLNFYYLISENNKWEQKIKRLTLAHLYVGDPRTPLRQASADNLAQICPMNSTRDTIPAHEKEVSLIS